MLSFIPSCKLHGLTGLSRDWDSYRIRNDDDIMAEVLERHFGRPPTADGNAMRLTRSYLSHLESGLADGALTTVEIPGARELLSSLHADGVAIGIATANLVDAARLRLASAGLWQFVSDLPFGADGGGAKARNPRPRHRRDAVWPKHRIVYLGDNLNDVDAGLRNGVHFIGFARDPRPARETRRAGARTRLRRSRYLLSTHLQACSGPEPHSNREHDDRPQPIRPLQDRAFLAALRHPGDRRLQRQCLPLLIVDAADLRSRQSHRRQCAAWSTHCRPAS